MGLYQGTPSGMQFIIPASAAVKRVLAAAKAGFIRPSGSARPKPCPDTKFPFPMVISVDRLGRGFCTFSRPVGRSDFNESTRSLDSGLSRKLDAPSLGMTGSTRVATVASLRDSDFVQPVTQDCRPGLYYCAPSGAGAGEGEKPRGLQGSFHLCARNSPEAGASSGQESPAAMGPGKWL